MSADSGAPGTFRISFLSSYYTGSGFLCPSVQACGGRPAGVTDSQDSATRVGGDIALSATLLPFLEANLGMHSHSSSDNFGTPTVMQVLGDTYLGLKGFMPRHADNIFSFGGLGELRFLNGSGSIGPHTTNITLAALGTIDLSNRSNVTQRIPLRFHANAGYLFDNSSSIATATELARQYPITRIERFGLDINRVDSVLLGIGGEYVSSLFQPFAEWTLNVASNRQGYTCHPLNISPGDVCMSSASGMKSTPSRLTLGTRLTPPFHGLNAILALDIGTSGTSTFVEERAPEIPWNLYLGIGYAIDTVIVPPAAVPQAAPQIVKVPPPPEHHIIGTVVDEDNARPIADATIHFSGRDVTGLVSRADGTFDSGNLEAGEYKLLITAEGYKDASCSATIAAEPAASPAPGSANEPKNNQVKCSLKPAPLLGIISGTSVDADSGSPIAGVHIRVRDEHDRSVELQSNDTGQFRIENVPAGQAHIALSATGFLPNVVDVEVRKKLELHASLMLHKLPKKPNVNVSPNELKLSAQIHLG